MSAMTETTPYYLQGTSGYQQAVNIYRERGWEGTLPLPPDKKFPPPKGFTGGSNPMPSAEQLQAWMQENPNGNIGLRLPKGVIGLDVDSYGNKPGGASLFELINEFGPLPSTWMSTSRRRLGDSTSGIRLYRVGEDVKFKGNPKPGIEMIQFHHRYAVVWPSWHPQVDAFYEWWGPDGKESDPPSISELPMLPPDWVEGLRARTSEEQRGEAYEDIGPGDLKGVTGYGELVRRYIERARAGGSCHITGQELANQLRDNHCPYMDAMETYAEQYFEGTKDFTTREDYTIVEVLKFFEWAYNGEPRAAMGTFKRTEHHAEKFPPPTDPMGVADELNARWSRSGAPLLKQWREGWYRWTEMAGWTEVSALSVRSDVFRMLQHAFYEKLNPDTGELEPQMWLPNVNKVRNVEAALMAVCALDDSISEPSWLGGHGDLPAHEIVACQNGLLHVPTRTLLPPDPSFFSQTALGLDFDQRAPTPTEWLKFLNSLWPDDPDAISTLAEVFGYLISGRTDLQKIMLLLGPPRSGKGTIARVLTELVGEANIASPTLMSLGSHFGLQALIGKSLAIIGDARVDGQGGKEIVAKLLGISGEDTVSIDRKNRNYWTGRLSTRFLILTNEIPNLRDSGGALAKRLVTLRMTESWLGREDHQLTERLMGELPGIMNWALDGYDRVKASGSITVPESSDEVTSMIEDMVSPMKMFIEEMCVVGPGISCLSDDFYQAYSMWAVGRGFAAGSTTTVGRDLRAVLPNIERKRVSIEGIQRYHYFGVSCPTRPA